MTSKELLREMCNYAKAHGVKLSRKQAMMALEAFKEVSIDACRRGDRVVIRNFMSIKGVMTKPTKLPDGTISIPRLKIKVVLSELLKESFRIEQKELRENKELEE